MISLLRCRSHGVNLVGQLAPMLTILTILGSGCDVGDDEAEAKTQNVGGGIAIKLLGGSEQGYLATSGLFTFNSTVLALGSGGQIRWTATVPGSANDLMLGQDNRLYVALSTRVAALDTTGRQESFAGAASGTLAWHPWGLPMVYGEGVVVLDFDGYPVLSALKEERILALAVDTLGRIYTLSSPADAPGDPVIWTQRDAQFEPLWWVEFGPASNALWAGLATAGDMVVASHGNFTEARRLNGDSLWRVVNAAGEVLIDHDETTYIFGSKEAAVAPDGEVLWSHQRGGKLVLTSGGLAGMLTTSDPFAGVLPAMVRLDKATGEIITEEIWEPMSGYVAPVVIGSRLVGAGHRIDTSQSFGPTGDISVSQSAELIVGTGPSPGASSAPWPDGSGPKGTRAAPADPGLPDAAGVLGLWVAADGSRVRAMEFRADAPAFGLQMPAYGIWDYDRRERARLVQVGTWQYEGDRILLEPTQNLSGADGNTSLGLYPSPPGGLRIDDPLQSVVRTFARAAALPAASAGTEVPLAIAQMHAERGPSDRNSLRLVAPIEGTDEYWAAMQYDYAGILGNQSFLGSNIGVVGGRVTGNLFNEVVGRLRADGTLAHAYHIDAPGLLPVRAIAPEGDGVRIYGPFDIGPDTAKRLYTAVARPTAGASGYHEMALEGEVPWLGADAQGRELQVQAAAPLAANRGMVYAGLRAASGANEAGVVESVDPSGKVRWQARLDSEDGPATFFAVGESNGAVFALGTFSGTLMGIAKSTHSAHGIKRTFLAKLNGNTGAVEALRPLGEGGLNPAIIEAAPDGGIALLGRPLGRFSTGLATAPQVEAGGRFVVATFDSELSPQWTRIVDGGYFVSLAVDKGGYAMLAGTGAGAVTLDGRTLGGPGLQTPLVELSPCGDAMVPRHFRADVRLEQVVFDTTNRAIAVGGYLSDIVEPPFVATFEGKAPTPSSPTGGTNNLLLALEREGRATEGWAPFCEKPKPNLVTLSVAPYGLGGGRVVSEPAGIDCPGKCTAPFPNLSEVKLVATPAPGDMFAGFARQGSAAADCAGVGPCTVLMLEDTLVRAHFEAAALKWAVPLVTNTSSDTITKVAGHGDFAAATSTQSLFLAEAGQLTGQVSLTGSGIIWSVAAGSGGRAAVGVSGQYAWQFAAGGPQDGCGVIAMGSDGEPMWARALYSESTWPETLVQWSHSGQDVIAAWVTQGHIEIDGFEITASQAALGRFHATTGELKALVPLGERPTAVGTLPDGRVWIRGGGALGGPAEPLVGQPLPNTSGPWFVLFSPDLEPLRAWRWSSWDPPVPAAQLWDPTASQAPIHYLDSELRVGWMAVLSGVGNPRDYADQAPGRLVLGDVPLEALRLPVWSIEHTRATLQVIGPGALPGASFVTPTADNVNVIAVAAWGTRAYAAVKARALRNPSGGVAWSSESGAPENALISVDLREVSR